MTVAAPGPAGKDGAPTVAQEPERHDETVARLERRWQREREARLESERIAEAGLRRLWEATQELDRRVEERTAELLRARADAEAAARAKTEFLANLSHEVGTPLQTILSALELARPASTKDRERLDVAARAVVELRDLFRNLLELSQMEVGSVDLRPAMVELAAVADDLAVRWRDRCIARGILLVPHASGRATVDRDRLTQVADALLDNATKFARPGTVQLGLTAADGAVVLTVEDEGPGVADHALEHIFEPFVQLDGANDRSVGGAGIGLALVRGLAHQLGGTATASHGAAGGLAVHVTVPDTSPEPLTSPLRSAT